MLSELPKNKTLRMFLYNAITFMFLLFTANDTVRQWHLQTDTWINRRPGSRTYTCKRVYLVTFSKRGGNGIIMACVSREGVRKLMNNVKPA